MQETQPVRYWPEYNLWEVFRYQDVRQVLSDSATFSSEKSREVGGLSSSLVISDPPQHRQLRGLVSKEFTPQSVEGLAPHLIKIVDEMFERIIARRKKDVIPELTYLLPVHAIAELLGLPPGGQERSEQLTYQMLHQMLGTMNSDKSELFLYFSDMLNERKCDLRAGLISRLYTAKENGAHLTHEEIVSMCVEMLVAGTLNTTLLLERALSRLCQHLEIYQAVHDDPSLIPGVVEETLRCDFPGFHLWRTARHDTVFNGHEIKTGQDVLVWTAAANFDETYFPHSEQFDIRRSPNPQLTLGHGPHFCLGYLLARLQGRIVLERTLAHFSEMHLTPEDPVQYGEQVAWLMQSLGLESIS